jgi:hypothetical protein
MKLHHPQCLVRGTPILTPAGEREIQLLSIGDDVVTRLNGIRKIKWIGRQSFIAGDAITLVTILPGALGGAMPVEPLVLSSNHCVLVNEMLVRAEALVNGKTIVAETAWDNLEFYQIELDTHDCVMARGMWVESYADRIGRRQAFHNAETFYQLYPDHITVNTALCAPLAVAGHALDTALRPLVARASEGYVPGHMQGAVDIFNEAELHGWAMDEANPELPVLLEIVFDGTVFDTVLACDYREDLAQAGIGRGRSAFFYKSNVPMPVELRHLLVVRRAVDGFALRVPETVAAWA